MEKVQGRAVRMRAHLMKQRTGRRRIIYAIAHIPPIPNRRYRKRRCAYRADRSFSGSHQTSTAGHSTVVAAASGFQHDAAGVRRTSIADRTAQFAGAQFAGAQSAGAPSAAASVTTATVGTGPSTTSGIRASII